MSGLAVYKFGGTSVGDADRIRHAAGLVRRCDRPVVVVVSAMGGITDKLIGAAELAGAGEPYDELVHDVRRAHHEARTTLGIADDSQITAEMNQLFDEFAGLLVAAGAVGQLAPRSRDRIISIGEKLSARLFAHALHSEGQPAVAVDADTFLETDEVFGAASPLTGVMEPTARAVLEPLLAEGKTPIVTGFCGRAPCGSTTTLGRGGSDYSATLVAAALGADDVTIWTDVPGVYSADPRAVADARLISQLNYREAGELSYYGASVLHPRTIQPLIDTRIPVRIRSTFEPDAEGTLIDGTVSAGSHPVKAVSAVRKQALVSIEGTGMVGVPGIAARIFSTLAVESISVTMISQSSAESSVCMAVPADRAAAAEVALRRAFRLDLAHGDVEDIRIDTDMALIAVVGLGMDHTRGVAGRVFDAVARAGVNLAAIAQGSSELNITFAVEEADCATALRAVHHEFGLHRIDPGRENSEHFDLLLFGFGRIGRELAEQVRAQASHIRERFGTTPRIVAVADRSGYLFDPNGLSDERVRHAADAKSSGQRLCELDGGVTSTNPAAMLESAMRYRLSRPVLVDTSDAETTDLWIAAFGLGADVVTANKGPLAGPRYTEIVAAVDSNRRLLRKEATVGAGLPIVDTVEHLVMAGDRIELIAGCLSGSLAFVLSQLAKGEQFADVLHEADRRGYLEPNPVLDLAGEDVLRKAIILSRVCGFEVADDRINCTGLVERTLLDQSRATFEERIPALADVLAKMIDQAKDKGLVVRYVAQITPDSIDVGPRVLKPSSLLGALDGTENAVLIHSERYSDHPLVVSGPGAGVGVTAMGVLTDVLRIVAERI